VALVIVLTLVAAAMLVPGLVVGPGLDAAVFSHVGAALLDGVPPYLGAWDHKPPGIYLASATAQALLGWLGPWTADWLLSLGATVVLGIALAAVLARLGVTGWPRTLAAVGATILASHYQMAWGGGLTEPVATALVATSMVIAMRPPGRAGLIAVGALLALSLLVSPQVLPGAALVTALALALQPARSRAIGAALLSGAAAVPMVVTVAWLWVIGALPAALDAVVTYSAAYRAASEGYGAVLGPRAAGQTVLLSLYLITPAVLGAVPLATASQLRRRVVAASLLWIGGSVVLFAFQGHFYAHYAIAVMVPLGILAGLGLDRIRGSLVRADRSRGMILRSVPLVAALVVSVLAGVDSAAAQVAVQSGRSARMRAVALELRQLPDGSLLVWGAAPRLYDLAGRPVATRYIYFMPLTTPGYSTPAMIDQMARALADDPPSVIVDAGSDAPGLPGFLPLLIDRPVLTDGRNLDLLDPLRAFVAARYELAATVAGWPIYVLRAEAPS
jgi:hypothetical protein